MLQADTIGESVIRVVAMRPSVKEICQLFGSSELKRRLTVEDLTGRTQVLLCGDDLVMLRLLFLTERNVACKLKSCVLGSIIFFDLMNVDICAEKLFPELFVG